MTSTVIPYKYNTLLSYLEYTILFLIVINFGGIPWVFFPLQIDTLIFACSVLLFILRRRFVLYKRSFLITLCLISVLIIHSIITHSNQTQYIVLTIRLISVLLYLESLGWDILKIKKKLILILWTIMYLALINFILANTMSFLYRYSTSESGFIVHTIFCIFNYNSNFSLGPLVLYRNQGIFWEPGILQIISNILVFNILIEENKSISKAILPITIILTTFSTTGLMILFFIFIVKYRNIIFSKRILKIQNIIPILLISVYFIPLMISNIEDKTSGNEKISYQLRMFDLLSGIQLIQENPILGVGMDSEKIKNELSKKTVYIDDKEISEDRGNTNSIITLFISFGLPFAFLFLRAIYKQKVFCNYKVFFVIIMLSLASEPLMYNTFIVLLILSSLRYSSNIERTTTVSSSTIL